MTSSDIIKAFGGIGPVSEIAGQNRKAVEQWKRIGIPPQYWHKLVEAGESLSVSGITFAALEATRHPRPTKQAAA